MSSDIDKVNLALAEARKTQETLELKRQQDHNKAVVTVKQMIEMYEIKAEELGFIPPFVDGRRIRRNGVMDVRHIVHPKYRGPNGETWAGRGGKPKWLIAAIEAGATVEEFLIDAQENKVLPLHRKENAL